MRKCLASGGYQNGVDAYMSPVRHSQPKDFGNGHTAPYAALFEQGDVNI